MEPGGQETATKSGDCVSPDPERYDRKLRGDIARLLGVVAAFALIAYLLHLPAVRAQLDVRNMREHFQDRGVRGALLFLLVSGALTGIGIPRIWISVAAGALFGAVVGTLLGHLGSILGASLNFFLARSLLRGPVRRRMPARMKVWYKRFNENGFRWLLVLRLFPLSNATLTNCIGGISKMKYPAFLGATFIGYLPLTIVFALFGSSAAKRDWMQLVVAAGIFLLVVVGRSSFRRLAPREEENR